MDKKTKDAIKSASTSGSSKVMKFYERGMETGMTYIPIMPPIDYSTDRMNPLVPLPMNPYPTSPFMK